MINQSTLSDFKLSVFFGQIMAVEGVDVALFLDESSIIISSNAFILLPFTFRGLGTPFHYYSADPLPRTVFPIQTGSLASRKS